MSTINDIGESELDELAKGGRPVLVDFWAEWCGPCKSLAPTLEKLSQQFDGKVEFVKVNVDHHTEVRDRFGVRGIPTLLLLKDGQEIGRTVGSRSLTQLTGFLDGYVGTKTDQPQSASVVPHAFGGDAMMKADCISRLAAQLERKRTAPQETMWDGQVYSALGFVANTADPDEIARLLGIPEAAVSLAEMLSSYQGTHLKAAEYVVGWLNSISAGANLSTLISSFVARVLEGELVRTRTNEYPALDAIRKRLIEMQHPAVGALLVNDPRWTSVRDECKAVADAANDYDSAALARLLSSAAWTWDEDPTAIQVFIREVAMYAWRKLQMEIDWKAEDQKRFDTLATQIMNEAKARGEDWPRGNKMGERIAEIDAELVRRFRYQYDEGYRVLGQEGRNLANLFVDLTAQCPGVEGAK